MRRIYVVLFAMLLITATGCYRNQVELPPKAARAVTTMALSISAPETSFVVSGSVQSWKTEQIGFEVEGRLQWVLEPGKNINGRDKDSDGKLLPALAKVDPSRYKVALASAEAALDVAVSDKDVINIRITDSIPSDIESAEADVALAKIEFDRNQLLKRQNAVSQSEYETAANRLQTQQARLSSLQSSFKQAEAELKSAVARVRSAQQSVNDAKRDLANTTLYASYSGQISEVQVVPGSVVTAGSPVVTLQKMDPIKVEIEVSAEQSREIQRRRQLPITFTLPDGSTRKQKAMVYLVDPSADTSTHTFTVTLLVINERTRPPLPAHLGERGVARTQDIWPLDVSKIVGGAAGIRLVEEAAIETVGEESNIWVIQDYKLGDTMPEVVKVKKQPVQRTDLRLPFLGNWVFRQVTFEDDSIDPKSLVAGKLEFPDNVRTEWDGEKPLIVLGTLPMALAGAWLGLNLTNNALGFMPQLGILALFGIVLNTAIIFVEFADILIAEKIKSLPDGSTGPIVGLTKKEFHDCLIAAGQQRMLPIFLTTATTVGGLLPLALGGGPLWVGLAWCMIVGLSFTTLLTLFVVPALYAILVETFRVRPIAVSQLE